MEIQNTNRLNKQYMKEYIQRLIRKWRQKPTAYKQKKEMLIKQERKQEGEKWGTVKKLLMLALQSTGIKKIAAAADEAPPSCSTQSQAFSQKLENSLNPPSNSQYFWKAGSQFYNIKHHKPIQKSQEHKKRLKKYRDWFRKREKLTSGVKIQRNITIERKKNSLKIFSSSKDLISAMNNEDDEIGPGYDPFI